MTSVNQKKHLSLLAICAAVILICGLVMANIKTAGGTVTVQDVVISPYGADLSITMYIPDSALETDENGNFINAGSYPAVMVNPGFTEDRSCLENISIELARRGFVVAQYDMYGHGLSDAITTRGYGSVPNPFTGDCAQLGAYDVLDYLRTLGFVDQSRIGMAGHSLGGSATGSLAANSAGFFTLEDKLLNLLHNDFGLTITAEQVAQQDPDAIAAAELSEADLAVYEERKAAITAEHNTAVRNVVILDANVGFALPKAVEVAGNEVWRDVQANLATFQNISGGMSKGIADPSYCQSSQETLSSMSQDVSVERDTWYALNLSGTAERELSTPVSDFYTSPADETVRTLADSNSLRVLVQPRGWHAFTYISSETTTATVQFFISTMGYDNGNIEVGSNAAAATTQTTSSWKIEAIASAVAVLALLVMVLPLAMLLLDSRPLAGMQVASVHSPASKLSVPLILTMLIAVLVPFFTYPKGVGWGVNIPGSMLSTVQIPTQTAFWAFIMAAILFAVLLIKYFAFDKKQTGMSFIDLYGLRISGANLLRSILLAVCVFLFIAVLLNGFYELFAGARMRATPLGRVLFASLSTEQYYSYLLYYIYFLPFYLINSMLVNSLHFEKLGEKKTTLLVAAINGGGMFVLAFFQIVLGLYRTGAAFFPTVPGTSSTIYNLPFMAVMLFCSTIFTRKLYSKTGSSIPGALMSAAVFTFVAIQSFAYYAI